MNTALALALGITSTLAAQAHWSTIRLRWHRLLSMGAKPQGYGAPMKASTEAFIASYARPAWTVDTGQLHIQLRHWAMEE